MLIGILICGDPPEVIKRIYGDYGKIYKSYILSLPSSVGITFRYFRVVDNIFPSDDDIAICDCFMLTGSKYSTYDNFEWIHKLRVLIRHLDVIRKKMIGICFGHQIIADALGCKIEKNSNGWEVSVCNVKLNSIGKKLFSSKKLINKNSILISQSHKDIVSEVNVDSGLKIFCYNEHCKIQGMIKGNHILTFQGHPEYFPQVIEALLNERKHIIPERMYAIGMSRKDEPTDSLVILDVILEFIRSHVF